MRILLLTSAHNSMSQRIQVELWERGHEVSVELALSDDAMIFAARTYQPDLIVAPMLKKAIPQVVWQQWVCFIVHPGIRGDRGPSSLDWAILEGAREWGVTVLQANAEMDAGDIWAWGTFPMRQASKSSLYTNEVVECGVQAVLQAVERFATGSYRPQPLNYADPQILGRLRPAMRQSDRCIDWHASTDEVARRIRCADGSPGVQDTFLGGTFHLFGAHEEDTLRGEPGSVIATRNGAICRATGDGAVWITHLKRKLDGQRHIKLPATMVLGQALAGVPEVGEAHTPGRTWRDIRYEQDDGVGHLHFAFHNGAMSTGQCIRLRAALRSALEQPTRVLVLWGGPDYFSNGIDLNTIEAAANPADVSWDNINAIDDVVQDVLGIEDRLVIAALQGNAGAGGAVLPLAADLVYARRGVVLNPHYKGMGGLYGSEFWTWLLPRRVGYPKAIDLTENLLPVGTAAAQRMGLIEGSFGPGLDEFRAQVRALAHHWAHSAELSERLAVKRTQHARQEGRKPHAEFRAEELVHMRQNFYGADPRYHLARRSFVHKLPPQETPPNIALHRRLDWQPKRHGDVGVLPLASADLDVTAIPHQESH